MCFWCERWSWEEDYEGIQAKSLMTTFSLTPYLSVLLTHHPRSLQIPGKCIINWNTYVHMYV